MVEQRPRVLHAAEPDEAGEHGVPRGDVAARGAREVGGGGREVAVREASGDDGVPGDDVAGGHIVEEAARGGRSRPARHSAVRSAFQETASRRGMASNTLRAAATSPARASAVMRWLSRTRRREEARAAW